MAKFTYPKDSEAKEIIINFPSGSILVKAGQTIEIKKDEEKFIDGFLFPVGKRAGFSDGRLHEIREEE